MKYARFLELMSDDIVAGYAIDLQGYDAEFVKLIKERLPVGERAWSPKESWWTISEEYLDDALQVLNDLDYEILYESAEVE